MYIEKLDAEYPDAAPELEFSSDFQLLIAVILSAQTTDRQVNVVTRELFRDYGTPERLASLSLSEIEHYLRSIGFFRAKAQNIKKTAQMICERFGGSIPVTREELMTLPGVGRKTANVVLSVAHGLPAIAVDTHVFRLSHRMGLSKGKTPEEVERDLMKCIRKDLWSHAHHLLIFHGRRVCKAQNPKCSACILADICPQRGVGEEKRGTASKRAASAKKSGKRATDRN